jgi:hypothetical protein
MHDEGCVATTKDIHGSAIGGSPPSLMSNETPRRCKPMMSACSAFFLIELNQTGKKSFSASTVVGERKSRKLTTYRSSLTSSDTGGVVETHARHVKPVN